MTKQQQIEKELASVRATYMADYESVVAEYQSMFPNLITKAQDDETKRKYTETVELRITELQKLLQRIGNDSVPAIQPPEKPSLLSKIFPAKTHSKAHSDIYAGVGVLVIKGNKIVLGMRQGSHCAGQYNLPGGHIDYGEDLTIAAIREVKEETGLNVNVRMFDKNRVDWFITNNLLPVGKLKRHYLGAFLVADYVSGELVTKEPMKNKGYNWTSYDTLLHHAKPGCAWLPTEFLIGYRSKIGL